ncbi:MAG TPA: hypothetical protein VN673_15945, partial [Clostridia bacterium]|nr:hypothetical protein [Clostridia bacterium]
MIFKSIRWRLQLWHSLILVLVLTTLGLTAYQVARENLLRQVDHNLQRELMSLERPERLERPPWANPGPGAPANSQPMRERRRGSDVAPRIQEAIESADLIEGTNTVYYVLWEADGTVVAQSTGAPAEVPFPARSERFSNEPPGDQPGPPELPDARTRDSYREIYR